MEELYGKSGTYEIRHIPSNKAYCGRTKNLGSRRDLHFGQLSKGKHPNHRLQTAYDTSEGGKDSFSFKVVEYCDEKEALVHQEQRLIDSGDYSFNIKRSASSGAGTKRYSVREYHTPWGIYYTTSEAALAGPMSGSAISRHCQFADEKINKASFSSSQFLQNNYDEDIIGQLTWRDIGFDFKRYHLQPEQRKTRRP